MTSGIYCIKNLVNDKKYIGQAQNIKNRKRIHLWMLKNNSKWENKYLKNAWSLYGEENFKFFIIEECPIELLDEKEIFWIKELHSHSTENGYNLSWGGEPSMRGLHHSEKTKKELSENMRDVSGKNNPFYKKHHSEESKEKISNAKKGLHFSEKTKTKMSNSHKGQHHSEKTKEKISKASSGENNAMYGKQSPFYGREHSEESKIKMSNIRKEYWRKKHEEEQKTINSSS